VRHAGAEVELDRYTGAAETLGVGKVFITEDVELADLDIASG
jgi:CYTH domain-containing protein